MKPILIIEDQASVREVIVDLLREFEVADTVESVSSITDARIALEKKCWNLVISDMYLPGGNILDLIESMQIEDEFSFPPILFMSGFFDNVTMSHATRLGIKRHHMLKKPIQPLLLIETVQKMLT